MRIGVPREIKPQECRVALGPSAVLELTRAGHDVLVESGAGAGVGFGDQDYRQAGATVVADADTVWADSQLIVKVKEPQPSECARLRPEHVLFTFLHLAADAAQAEALCRSRCVAIGYETVTGPGGSLPLLIPMSEIAGRMSIQVGAHYLQKPEGGSGVLLGGATGVPPASVVVIGAGTAGTHAVQMARGLGAQVTALDRSLPQLRALEARFQGSVHTLYSTHHAIEQAVAEADLVVGSVLIPGAAAPKLVSAALIERMRPGSVVVDIAIDQGGCFETSHPTTHAAPVFSVGGVVHYCVTNMPGAVARTATLALTHATLPYVLALAALGWERATREEPGLAAGLNVVRGEIVHAAVARSLGRGGARAAA